MTRREQKKFGIFRLVRENCSGCKGESTSCKGFENHTCYTYSWGYNVQLYFKEAAGNLHLDIYDSNLYSQVQAIW